MYMSSKVYENIDNKQKLDLLKDIMIPKQ